MILKRWGLEKYDKVTGRTVSIDPPEPVRRYWTKSGAYAEELRLNMTLMTMRLRWRYRAVRR